MQAKRNGARSAGNHFAGGSQGRKYTLRRSCLRRSSNVALRVQKKWAQMILEKTKTWELRTYSTTRRGFIHIAESGAGGMLVGRVRLVNCFQVTWSMLEGNRKRHRVPFAQWGRFAGRVYAWELDDAEKYEKPFPFGSVGFFKPPSPRSAFFLFCNDRFGEISRDLGTSKRHICNVKAGELWKQMTEQEKKPFRDEQNRVQKMSQRRRCEFKVSPKWKKLVRDKKAMRQRKKKARVERAAKVAAKAFEMNDQFKKPLSAYFLFLQGLLGGNPHTMEVMTQAPQLWKALSVQHRDAWEKKAKEQKEAYDIYIKTPVGHAALKAYNDSNVAAKEKVMGQHKMVKTYGDNSTGKIMCGGKRRLLAAGA